MWRPFTKGLQTAGRGLVDYKERSTPRLELATELSHTVSELGVLRPVRSKVGILFDPLCIDFQNLYTKCYKVDQNIYLNSICGAYGAMLDAGVRADIVRIDEISNYSVLILSNHIVIGKDTAKALKRFVEAGGILVCDGKIGTVDEYSMLNSELPGGDINDIMGLEYIDSDYENMDFDFAGRSYLGYYGKEITALNGSEAIAHFEDLSPAIVRKESGRGRVITVNTHLWYSYNTQSDSPINFASYLADTYALRDICAGKDLYVRLAENENDRCAFIFNYTDNAVCSHIKGAGFDEDITLAAHEVKILRTKRI
jgi:beta-galactosidase